MRVLIRWLGRLVLALLVLVAVLLAPVAYTEVACRGSAVEDAGVAILPPEHHRAEARTLLTYPEWHIVHAYDDYAEVIRAGDPHDFGYLRAIAGFWQSLCPLSVMAADHGGFDIATKQMVYTIGVSFSLELALKAAYEETLGRLFVLLRGNERAPLDDLSAQQAAGYAAFLQQTPWYLWNFRADAAALRNAAGDSLRDRERAVALGIENAAKASYAQVIAAAVAGMGSDALTIRSIVTGATPETLATVDGVAVVEERPEGIEIQTPRYRALTHILADLAETGADLVEIAGNDDIMLTVLTPDARDIGALHRFPRQGYGDYRQLLLVPLPELLALLRDLPAQGIILEHVHDY